MLTVTQAAERLNLSIDYVRRLVEKGKIKATKVNSRLWLIDEQDLDAYRAAHPRSKAGRPRKDTLTCRNCNHP